MAKLTDTLFEKAEAIGERMLSKPKETDKVESASAIINKAVDSEQAMDVASQAAQFAAAQKAARSARDSLQAAQMAGSLRSAAGAAVQNGPVKQVAMICGRAGAAGAVVDGAAGGLRGLKYLREGKIDGTQYAKHVSAEAGCGFVTSSAGTAGTLAIFMITGSMGPLSLAAGMGASMGSRYLYKKVVGETLPDDDEENEETRADAETHQSSPARQTPPRQPQQSERPDNPDMSQESGGPQFRTADDLPDMPETSSNDNRDASNEDADSEDDSDGGSAFEDIGPDE